VHARERPWRERGQAFVGGDRVSRAWAVVEAGAHRLAWATMRVRFRFLARDADGERLVGEYTFDHTATRT
jgi:hypothetical protein